MKYHNIITDDMRNGDGLRTTLFVSGCIHHCKGCHNPITWDPDVGLEFTAETLHELESKLKPAYISGLTISGGDPLLFENIKTVGMICNHVKRKFPNKTIWVYTGYRFEDIKNMGIMRYIDVLVDGRFVEALCDANYPWAGSTNQRVIDVRRSLVKGETVLYD